MELAASSRRCSAVKLNSSLGQPIFVLKIAEEHGRVVGVERDHQASIEIAADGMVGEAGAAAGAEIR